MWGVGLGMKVLQAIEKSLKMFRVAGFVCCMFKYDVLVEVLGGTYSKTAQHSESYMPTYLNSWGMDAIRPAEASGFKHLYHGSAA